MGKRLISCDFIKASGFLLKVSNKAKLIYICLFVNADDKGFVSNGLEIAQTLDHVETETKNVALVEETYETAIEELVQKGLIFQFYDKHNNYTILIRHWFYHNRLVKGLETNFQSLMNKVELIDNEYYIREKPYKEKQINNINMVNTEEQEEVEDNSSALLEVSK